MLHKRRLINLLTVLVILSVQFSFIFEVQYVFAGNEVEVIQGKCPNEFPIAGLLTDFCYKCLFPIRIGGFKVFSYGNLEDDVDISKENISNAFKSFMSSTQELGQQNNLYDIDPNNINASSFNPSSPVCLCFEKVAGVPVPHVGLYISFWDPARLAEVVLRPGCFPTLFGSELHFGAIDFGTYGVEGSATMPSASEEDLSYLANYTLHYYSFPLLLFLSTAFQFDYCTDYISQFDLLHFSEVDPSHNDDIFSAFVHPEVFLFANPIAQLICTVDSIASSIGFPLDFLFWCAGTWGSIYPYTGNVYESGDPLAVGGLIISRGLAKLGRIGLELDTSGSGAKCGMAQDDWFTNMYMPLLKKSQYRFQLLKPVPSTIGKCCHKIGMTTFFWGLGKNIPTTAGQQIYMIWKKRNCCLKLL